MKKNKAVCSIVFFIFIFTAFSNSKAYAEIFDFVMGKDKFSVPKVSLPKKGKAFTDKNFHTTIVRITNKKTDRYSGPGIENEYARSNPENSDGTLLVLRGNGGTWYLYDLTTYKKIKKINAFNDGGSEPEPRWDPVEPNIFYYLSNMELRSYNTETDASTLIHDFKNEFPSGAFITTKTEGDSSSDRRYWCFMVQDESYNLLSVIVYDRTEDNIVGQKSSGFDDGIDWVSMDMSGEHCLIGYDYVSYIHVFSRDFSSSINLPDGSNAHGDLALNAEGKDVFVYQNTSTDYISMADLDTGTEVQLLAIPFNINPDIGVHFSGNCNKTPGWVLVSTYGCKNTPHKKKHSWMDTQLFMVELKESPRIWRIAHTYSYLSKKFNGKKNYFAEAFAAINTNGTKIYFGSNWEIFTSRYYTDAYQVTLPENWLGNMPLAE